MVLGEALRSGDAVEQRHLHVHDYEIWTQFRGEGNSGLAVSRLTDDLESVVTESFDDIESDERLILGHHDAAGGLSSDFLVWHDCKPTVFLGSVSCAGVAEWQTRSTQNALLERACGFESHHRHEYVLPRAVSLGRADQALANQALAVATKAVTSGCGEAVIQSRSTDSACCFFSGISAVRTGPYGVP